jgi:hypothetical protein
MLSQEETSSECKASLYTDLGFHLSHKDKLPECEQKMGRTFPEL